MEELPNLGVGVGFREPLRSGIFLNQNKIDFLEITADHYFDASPKKLAELDLLRSHFPLIPHSLDLSLGSAEGIDEQYLEKLAEVVERIKPHWFSDHICFTRSGGVKIGHLAPVPFTDEALVVFVKNIERVKKRIDIPLILENITYNLEYPSSQMSEGAFIKKLLDETGCGLLLDITNLYINSVNLNRDWRKVLDDMPLDKVVQLHFTGARKSRNRLIDAHADKTDEKIWTVFETVAERCGINGSILERDEDFPDFAEILYEVERAGSIQNNRSYAKISNHTL